MKAFITKENIGKYLDDLPSVSYEFSTKKRRTNSFSYSGMGYFIFCLSVATVAACIVFNNVRSNKLV